MPIFTSSTSDEIKLFIGNNKRKISMISFAQKFFQRFSERASIHGLRGWVSIRKWWCDE